MSLTRSFLSVSLVLCAAILSAAAPVLADSSVWSPSAITAAPSYFPSGTSAMVVGVGANAQPIARQLLETLQASESLELAIDAQALGNIDTLPDDAIVKRAFARPIQRLAIVRVFPAGASLKAVVTVYGAEGQVTTAFTIAPGRTLAENPSPEGAEDGVRRDEMTSVQGGIGTASEGEDVITYNREHLTGVTTYGVVTLEHGSFYKNGRLLSDTPSLYEALGMNAEANEYRRLDGNLRSVRPTASVLATLGLTGVIGFGIWAIAAAPDGSHYDVHTDTHTKVERSATVPLLFTAGSAVMLVMGIRMAVRTPMPRQLTPAEAVALVDAHNKKKRRMTDRRTGPRDITLAPSAMPSGGGFVLGGSF